MHRMEALFSLREDLPSHTSAVWSRNNVMREADKNSADL